jgi:hypothetical protein
MGFILYNYSSSNQLLIITFKNPACCINSKISRAAVQHTMLDGLKQGFCSLIQKKKKEGGGGGGGGVWLGYTTIIIKLLVRTKKALPSYTPQLQLYISS